MANCHNKNCIFPLLSLFAILNPFNSSTCSCNVGSCAAQYNIPQRLSTKIQDRPTGSEKERAREKEVGGLHGLVLASMLHCGLSQSKN